MTISELIQVCERRIVHLQTVRGSAVALGDMTQIAGVDVEIAATQATLNQLRKLTD